MATAEVILRFFVLVCCSTIVRVPTASETVACPVSRLGLEPADGGIPEPSRQTA